MKKRHLVKRENKANSKPIKANKMPKQSQNKAKQTQFQRQYMLPLMTINTRRNPLGYYAEEIEAANACDRPAENHLSSTCGSVVGLSFIGNQIGEQVGQTTINKKFLDSSCFFNHSIAHRLIGRLAQLARAPARHAGGRWFKSSTAQFTNL